MSATSCGEAPNARRTILVVDDDQGLLTLMKIRLEAAGYKAIVSESGSKHCAGARRPL